MAKIGTQMVCINCEEVFFCQPACPACGSKHIYPLCRWVPMVPETRGETLAEKFARQSGVTGNRKRQICSFFNV